MQLSRLYSALFCLKATNRARHPFSVKSLSIFHLSTSVVLLAASQAAWAQTDINNDSQSDVPSVVLDTIVGTSSADASADGLPDAYEGGQVATGSRVGILGNQDIMDTPFSTTSYTNEYIANQQAQSVGDLLKKDPTVRVARGFGNFQEAYFMRGFITTSDDTMFNDLYGILPR